MKTEKLQSELEYISDYRGYALFQNMENGYYIVFNQHDEQICNEATIKMATDTVDSILDEEVLKV